ncbi:MAG: hypothetical protein V6Z81_06515 [Parvularculales bacterium]
MSIRIDTQAVLDKGNAGVPSGTIATTDRVFFIDVDDSNKVKRDSVSDLLSLVTGGTGEATTFGIAFPGSPESNDNFIFTADVDSGLTWKDTDGTTDLTAASKFDVAKYNGTDWVKQIDYSDFVSVLNDLTTAAPAVDDIIAFGDTSDSNGNRKATVAALFDLQNAVDGTWLMSADFTNGDLASTGTLEWTAETGAPAGAVDGNNTQCKLPKSNAKPNTRIIGLWVSLKDGDSSDAIQSEQFIPWLNTSPDLSYRLYADDDSWVEFSIELGDTDSVTPIVTVTTTQDAGNTLTGMYLTISPAVIG